MSEIRRKSRKEAARRSSSLDGDSDKLSDKLKKYHWGVYVLICGALWAVIQLVRSVMYFF